MVFGSDVAAGVAQFIVAEELAFVSREVALDEEEVDLESDLESDLVALDFAVDFAVVFCVAFEVDLVVGFVFVIVAGVRRAAWSVIFKLQHGDHRGDGKLGTYGDGICTCF
jgi:hypothetical protein